MKKLKLIILLLVLCVSCLPFEEEDDAQLRQWKMSGKASFSDDVTSDVKFGLFFVASTTMPTALAASYPLVSNVVSLGSTAGETSFTMSVDCTETKPSDGHYLMMFMWRDTDGDGAFTSGETSSQVIAQNGSASFIGDATGDVVCYYKYSSYDYGRNKDYPLWHGTDDMSKGWYQVCGSTYKNVKSIAAKQSGEYFLPGAIVKAKSKL